MLCTIVDKVTTLPLLGSVEPGLWHITQYCVSRRLPPWIASLSWQLLHVAMSTILRAEPAAAGTDLPSAPMVKSKYGLTLTVTPAAFT